MPGRDIEIMLKARDDASAKIAALEARIAEMAGNVKRQSDQVAEAFSFGKMAAGLGVARGVMEGFTGLTKLAEGDFRGMLDSIERLPMGLGEVVRAARGFVDSAALIGQNQTMNILAEKLHAEEILRGEQLRLDMVQAASVGERERLQLLERQRAEIEKLNRERDKLDKENLSGRFVIEDAQTAQAERHAAELTALRTKDRARMMEEGRKQAEQLEVQLGEEFNARAEASRKRIEEGRKEAEALEVQLGEEFNRRVEAERKKAAALSQLDGEIAAMRLRASGKANEAEAAEMRNKYAQEIVEARQAGETLKAQKLEELGAMELAQLKGKQQSEAAKGVSIAAVETRTLTSAPGYANPLVSLAQKQTTLAERQLESAKRLEDAIAKLEKKMPEFVNG